MLPASYYYELCFQPHTMNYASSLIATMSFQPHTSSHELCFHAASYLASFPGRFFSKRTSIILETNRPGDEATSYYELYASSLILYELCFQPHTMNSMLPASYYELCFQPHTMNYILPASYFQPHTIIINYYASKL